MNPCGGHGYVFHKVDQTVILGAGISVLLRGFPGGVGNNLVGLLAVKEVKTFE